MPKENEQYSEQETQRRFEKLLRSALTTPPKPLSKMKRRPKPKAKDRKSTTRRKQTPL